jgi:hypothetical protein
MISWTSVNAIGDADVRLTTALAVNNPILFETSHNYNGSLGFITYDLKPSTNYAIFIKTYNNTRTLFTIHTSGFRTDAIPAPKAIPKPAPKPAPKPVPKPAPKPAPKPVPKPAPKPAPKPGPRRCATTNKYCKVDDLSISSSITFNPDVSKTYIGFKNRKNPDQVVRIYDDLKKIEDIYVTQEGQFFAIGLDSNKFVYPIERNSSGFYIKYFILSRSGNTGFEEIAGQDKIRIGGRFKALLTINNGDRLRNNTYTTSAVTTNSDTVLKVDRLMDGSRTTYTFQRGGSSSKTVKKKGIIKKNRTEKHKVYN